jgi:hypothetical protein
MGYEEIPFVILRGDFMGYNEESEPEKGAGPPVRGRAQEGGRAQGIAPTMDGGGEPIRGFVGATMGVGVVCPFCGSVETELFSLFGQQLLTVQYYCNACHTPFERVKGDDILDEYAARKEMQA